MNLSAPFAGHVASSGLPFGEVLGGFSVRGGWRCLGDSLWEGRASKPSGERAIVRLTFSSMTRISVVELFDAFFGRPMGRHRVDWRVAIPGLDDDVLDDYWFDPGSGLVWPRRVSCHGRCWQDIPSLVERFNEKRSGGFGHWRLPRHSEFVRILGNIRYDGKGDLFRDSIGPPDGLWLDSPGWPVAEKGGVGILVPSGELGVSDISFVPLSKAGPRAHVSQVLEFPTLLVSSHLRDETTLLHT